MALPLLVGKLERVWLEDKLGSACCCGKMARASLVGSLGVVLDVPRMRRLAWGNRQLVMEEALVGMEAVAGVVPLAEGGTPG